MTPTVDKIQINHHNGEGDFGFSCMVVYYHSYACFEKSKCGSLLLLGLAASLVLEPPLLVL